MPNRPRAPLGFATVAALTLAFALLLPAPTLAASAPPKVVIIVGPTGPQTDSYRSSADQIAATASAAGANVTKVYSPNATWANVRAAVSGANIIVYLGHGNGFPSPYSSTEDPTKVNGWGLNRTTTNGDSDNWSTTMVYCGEEALLGTLTPPTQWEARYQWDYCGGSTNTDGIAPAPGFVMIYNKACYAPGAGETGGATEALARDRVKNFSYPVLALGASAYFATDINASSLVDLILRNPRMTFGDIARNGAGYVESAQRHFAHPDVSSSEIWIQRTYAMGRDDYWYAYAGNPNLTPEGAGIGLPFNDIATSQFRGDILWLADQNITAGCAPYKYCPTATVTRAQMASFLVRAMGLTDGAGANLFTDDNGSAHEGDIDKLATAGVTAGCAPGRFCPDAPVTRAQMASFLVRAQGYQAGAGANLFDDDDGSVHQADIDRLATAGVTSGCGYRAFCPDGLVTRGQMAAFLHRAFSD